MISRLSRIALLMKIALPLVSAVPASRPTTQPTTQPANPFTGRWIWVLDFTPGSLVGADAQLTQDGEKLTGTAGYDGHEGMMVTRGKVEGNRITFELSDGEGK